MEGLSFDLKGKLFLTLRGMILHVYKTEFITKDKEFVFRFKRTTSRERKYKKPKNIHNSRINPKTDKRASNWPGKRSSSRSFLKDQLILLNSTRTHDTSKFLLGSEVSNHVSLFGFVSFLFFSSPLFWKFRDKGIISNLQFCP